jgi:hypothetical protein
MASSLAAGMQTATWLSAGMDGGGRFFFSTAPHSSHKATKHEAAHAETEAVSEDGRCCMPHKTARLQIGSKQVNGPADLEADLLNVSIQN